jgi:hypothetical protein
LGGGKVDRAQSREAAAQLLIVVKVEILTGGRARAISTGARGQSLPVGILIPGDQPVRGHGHAEHGFLLDVGALRVGKDGGQRIGVQQSGIPYRLPLSDQARAEVVEPVVGAASVDQIRRRPEVPAVGNVPQALEDDGELDDLLGRPSGQDGRGLPAFASAGS